MLLVPLACLIMVGVVGYLIWPEIEAALVARSASPAFTAQPQTASVSADIERLKADLQTLQAVKPPAADVSGLEERVARLERNGADAASVLRLVDRIDRLETTVREMQDRRKADAALVLSIGLLKDAVDRGAPFDAELRALKALAPEDETVKKTVADLKPRAAAGIPAKSALTGRFLTLEAAIIRADSLPAESDGAVADWKRRALDRLLTVFTLRREDGELEGASVPAIVSRAHGALDRGDWGQAVHQWEALTGEPAKAAQIWLDAARARLTADREIADLAADAVAAAGAKL